MVKLVCFSSPCAHLTMIAQGFLRPAAHPKTVGWQWLACACRRFKLVCIRLYPKSNPIQKCIMLHRKQNEMQSDVKNDKNTATKDGEVQSDTKNVLALVSACGSNGLRYISVPPPSPLQKKNFTQLYPSGSLILKSWNHTVPLHSSQSKRFSLSLSLSSSDRSARARKRYRCLFSFSS